MRDVTYRLVIACVRTLFRLLGLRITLRGTEHIPLEGGAVLASNHVSYLDFTFVGLAGRDRGRFVRFMSKEAIFDPPGVGAAMHAMGHIPVDRSNGVAALRTGVRKARAGELVGVFPEGTISRSYTIKETKAGAAAIAIWEQVPLIPVVVWGSHRLLTTGPRIGLRRGKAVTILVGEPLHPEPDADPYAVTRLLHARLEEMLEEALDSYPDHPRNAADRWWLPATRGGAAPTRAVAGDLEKASVARREAKRAEDAAARAEKAAAKVEKRGSRAS
ncbi:MAG: lysophospholipid acyltransferase family protein [Lapillicoccus sp.]